MNLSKSAHLYLASSASVFVMTLTIFCVKVEAQVTGTSLNIAAPGAPSVTLGNGQGRIGDILRVERSVTIDNIYSNEIPSLSLRSAGLNGLDFKYIDVGTQAQLSNYLPAISADTSVVVQKINRMKAEWRWIVPANSGQASYWNNTEKAVMSLDAATGTLSIFDLYYPSANMKLSPSSLTYGSTILSASGLTIGGASVLTANSLQSLSTVRIGSYNSSTGSNILAVGSGNGGSGNYTGAFGSSNQISGSNSIGVGSSNTVASTNAAGIGYGNNFGSYASNSAAIGTSNTVGNTNSLAVGSTNSVNSPSSASFGTSNYNSGTISFTAGSFLSAGSLNEVQFGSYPLTPAVAPSSYSWVLSDNLFVVANGLSTTQRSNALTIKKNGDTTFTGVVHVPPGGDIPMFVP